MEIDAPMENTLRMTIAQYRPFSPQRTTIKLHLIPDNCSKYTLFILTLHRDHQPLSDHGKQIYPEVTAYNFYCNWVLMNFLVYNGFGGMVVL